MRVIKRLAWPLLAAASLFMAQGTALADSGKTPPDLSFFSGGDGGTAHWVTTTDQPPGDSDHQAIQLDTTNDAPSFSQGYAGILVHHVTGIPAASFPDSDFWLKVPSAAPGQASLGSPRLVVEFQTAAGAADGDAELDPDMFTGMWQHVSDVSDYPDSGWDIHSASCPFMYHQKWSVAQSCHSGDAVSSAFLVADAYGIHHLIDDVTVDGKTFTDAADNGGGNNDPAGPTASDPSQLPPVLPLP